jgi:hypothetical protein
MIKYILMLSLLLSTTQLLAKDGDGGKKGNKNGVFMAMTIPTAMFSGSDTAFRLGYRFGKVQPFASINYSSESTIVDDKSDTEDATSTFTAHLGLKYLLKTPQKSKVLPYIVGSFGTVINGETQAGKDVLKDVDQSTWIFNGAFGAQYAFTRSFSIGSELGLRYSTLSVTPKGGKETFSSAFGFTGQIFLEYIF